MGTVSFLGAALLDALSAEASDALGTGPRPEQWAAPAGRRLARLAVSEQLWAAVSATVGFDVIPTCRAVYFADPPGPLVRPYIDKAGYDLTVRWGERETSAAIGFEPVG